MLSKVELELFKVAFAWIFFNAWLLMACLLDKPKLIIMAIIINALTLALLEVVEYLNREKRENKEKRNAF